MIFQAADPTLFIMCEGLGDLVVFRNSDKPTVCYCLTPLRIAFDPIYQQKHVENAGIIKQLMLRVGSAVFRAIDRLAWSKYDQIFFISGEAARRAVRGGLTRQCRVEVLHPASGMHGALPSRSHSPMFLLPGRIMWTKNIELGIQAFLRFLKENPGFEHYRLVVAGIADKKSQSYLNTLRRMAHGCHNIEFRLHPSDQELGELYNSSLGVLFTPLNEDWGIVPLEAMSYGKPVISVNRGGPLESIRHGIDGFLVPPTEADFASAMAALAKDPDGAARMGMAGYVKSRAYTWDHVVGRIDESLDALVRADRGEFSPSIRLPELVEDTVPRARRVAAG